MLQNNPKLKSLIGSLWNTLYGGGISNPLAAIEQITYLLYIKMLDELDSKREKDKKDKSKSKFDGTYIPWIDESLYRPADKMLKTEIIALEKKRIQDLKPRSQKELKWSYFNEIPPNEILNHIKYNVFPFIKRLNDKGSSFSENMKDADFRIPKSSLLLEVIDKVNQIFIEIGEDSKD
jgi:type I restriction enzyme M protein